MTRKEKREREDAIHERIELGYTPRQAEKAQLAHEKLVRKVLRRYRHRCQQEVQDENRENLCV